MIDVTKLDFNQLPKRYADGAVGSYGKDVLFFGITSGNSFETYATSPKVAKEIANFFQRNVENYEKQFGAIDMTAPSVVSPIQAGDIKK